MRSATCPPAAPGVEVAALVIVLLIILLEEFELVRIECLVKLHHELRARVNLCLIGLVYQVLKRCAWHTNLLARRR